MAKLKFSKKSKKDLSLSDEKWKVLICDDEQEVHTMTKAVLNNFVFKNRKLELLSAYSAKEAYDILKKDNSISVILLDVVMESDYAGLELVKKIRVDLENTDIRIVLRTGQPGFAPEKDVILDYDINDYKQKTELTDVKLFTTIISALRSYKDIKTIQRSKKGLEKIIDATRDIYEKNSLELFSDGVLTQIVSILKLNGHSFLVTQDGFSLEKDENDLTLLASTGKYENKKLDEILDENIVKLLKKSLKKKKSLFLDDVFVGYIPTDSKKANLIYMTGCDKLNKLDKNLINIFSSNVSTAFNNLYLNKEIIDTQKELIETLGETVERRSKEASHHVKRVANISYELALKLGLDEKEAEIIRSASPMHDVGKIGIPDSILLKPDLLTSEEIEHMKKHAQIGYEILAHSKREVLKAASIIAYEHHERWDGKGYPRKLKAKKIHIYGRITAVADVFDALLHKRCYKDPWPIEEVVNYFKEESGRHFDPKIVKVLVKNIEIFKDIENIH